METTCRKSLSCLGLWCWPSALVRGGTRQTAAKQTWVCTSKPSCQGCLLVLSGPQCSLAGLLLASCRTRRPSMKEVPFGRQGHRGSNCGRRVPMRQLCCVMPLCFPLPDPLLSYSFSKLASVSSVSHLGGPAWFSSQYPVTVLGQILAGLQAGAFQLFFMS